MDESTDTWKNFVFSGLCVELNWIDVRRASISVEWNTTGWVVWRNNEDEGARFEYCSI